MNLSTQICVNILFFACIRSGPYSWLVQTLYGGKERCWYWFYLVDLLHCITFSKCLFFCFLVHCKSWKAINILFFPFVRLKFSKLGLLVDLALLKIQCRPNHGAQKHKSWICISDARFLIVGNMKYGILSNHWISFLKTQSGSLCFR